jgi:oligopeptide/dipeptide ABC transporter ATP-binding protein
MSGLLSVRGVRKTFTGQGNALGLRKQRIHAVNGVDLDLREGETLGIVGESGSGKSTLGRCILRLLKPDSGSISFGGRELTKLDGRPLRRVRKDMQMVFQDPYTSLDPHLTIEDLLDEPLRLHFSLSKAQRAKRVLELLDSVGLGSPRYLRRYPSEFSGGQRQRICIARALAVEPKLIICDEAVSALDVSTQAEIINLLKGIQRDTGVAYLFISHDLSVVRHISDRIAVMYLGRVVETGPAEAVYDTPQHPYSEALISAVLVPDPTIQRARPRIVLTGDAPNPAAPPAGCHFHPRCPKVVDICRTVDPPMLRTSTGLAACHLADGEPVASSASPGSEPAVAVGRPGKPEPASASPARVEGDGA